MNFLAHRNMCLNPCGVLKIKMNFPKFSHENMIVNNAQKPVSVVHTFNNCLAHIDSFFLWMKNNDL